MTFPRLFLPVYRCPSPDCLRHRCLSLTLCTMSRVAYRPTPAYQVANTVSIACIGHCTLLTSLDLAARSQVDTKSRDLGCRRRRHGSLRACTRNAAHSTCRLTEPQYPTDPLCNSPREARVPLQSPCGESRSPRLLRSPLQFTARSRLEATGRTRLPRPTNLSSVFPSLHTSLHALKYILITRTPCERVSGCGDGYCSRSSF